MALVNINLTVLAHAYVLYARALQLRFRGGTFAAPVQPALKSGTAMRTTVKSGAAFAVPAGPSTPPLEFIHEEAHTNVRFLSCDGHQLYERGVYLAIEVEGVRYIEMHRGPAAYVLGPPPSRSRDLELEGGVIACHVDYVYEPQDSHVRGTE